MTKETSRVQPAGPGAQSHIHIERRRRRLMATLAASFCVFALYLAWHASHAWDVSHEDESPIAAALAQDASGNTSGSATPDLVKRGEYLARAGDCVACHTADKSRPFAGGLPIATPFGTFYTPNITPDPDTGIGNWTDADFLQAMHEGIGKGGERL